MRWGGYDIGISGTKRIVRNRGVRVIEVGIVFVIGSKRTVCKIEKCWYHRIRDSIEGSISGTKRTVRNGEEESLSHVAMVAKFLDDNKPISHLKVY